LFTAAGAAAAATATAAAAVAAAATHQSLVSTTTSLQVVYIYINLYSLTGGNKERNIQTYKYGEKATKEKKTKKKQRASVGYMPLCCYMR